MKKVVLNISDSTWEKFRFEAIIQKKGIQKIIEERIFHKPFSQEIENAYSSWINEEIEKILKD